jgi:hypothetical protein
LKRIKTTPYHFFYSYTRSKYFKREISSISELYNLGWIPYVDKLFKFPKNLFPISMSIPKHYVKKVDIEYKTQKFVNYNIDPDLNSLFNQCNSIGEWRPNFDTTEKYLNQLDISKFGITTKRAGWDCLRHYEYASRGVVLCFKNLNIKPKFSAPFGLSNSNCIIYSSLEDLLDQISRIDDHKYKTLQTMSYNWVTEHTCEAVASNFLGKALDEII